MSRERNPGIYSLEPGRVISCEPDEMQSTARALKREGIITKPTGTCNGTGLLVTKVKRERR